MSIPELGASHVQVITRPRKALAAGEGLLRHSVPGETLLYKVTGDDTDGALDIFVLSIQPKSGPPLHIHHQQHETIYFMKGRYKVQVDDDVFCCEAGGFVHIPMGARHGGSSCTTRRISSTGRSSSRATCTSSRSAACRSPAWRCA